MLKMSNAVDVMKTSLELREIAEIFHKAIITGCRVELWVTDLPKMKMDSILNTKLTEVKIDEKDKLLGISTGELEFKFKFTEYKTGSSSASHDKFYFESENVSLRVTAFY